MAKIFKSNNGDVIISLTKDEQESLYQGMRMGIDELEIIKRGEAITDTDKKYADIALSNLSVIHDFYRPDNTAADIAKKYSSPAVYYKGSAEYDELDNMEQPVWEAFLDELGHYGLVCNYNNVYDTFTIG